MTRKPAEARRGHRSARQRRRRRQGGVAMLEALIVIGLLVGCMQCLWWTARYCAARHRAIVSARALAWQEALAGCDQTPLAGVADGLAADSGEVRAVDGVNGDADETPAWFAVTPTDGASVTLPLGPYAIGPSEVRASRRFACNERGGQRALDLRALGQTADLIGNVLSSAAE